MVFAKIRILQNWGIISINLLATNHKHREIGKVSQHFSPPSPFSESFRKRGFLFSGVAILAAHLQEKRKERKMKTKTKIAAFLAMLMFAHAPAWAWLGEHNPAGLLIDPTAEQRRERGYVVFAWNADTQAAARSAVIDACTGVNLQNCGSLNAVQTSASGCRAFQWIRSRLEVDGRRNEVHYQMHSGGGADRDAAIASLENFINDPSGTYTALARGHRAVVCTDASQPVQIRVLTLDDSGLFGGGGSSSKSFLKKNGGIILGGAAAIGLGVWALKSMGGDTPESTSFSPVAEYSNENGTRRWHVGSRYDWQKGDWSAYWKATKTDDSFSFGSGMEWTNDIVAAKFISGGNDGNSDLDFSLSAKRIFGLWTLSPEYRLDYRTSDTDKTLLHALSANAVWQGDKWTIRNSLGLSGESFAAFGKNATAKIQLRRDF